MSEQHLPPDPAETPDPSPAVDKPELPEVLVITGMSGAGRTTAAHALEDHGWYVVENLPPQLLPTLSALVSKSPEAFQRLAIVVDVRTEEHRRHAPGIPGSLVIDLTVLPWRLHPEFPWRIPEAVSADQRWILVCRHGYSTSVAAWALQRMGLTAVADVIGGFEAYRALLILEAARKHYPAFHIPMVHLPATISNNVPMTEFSLGSDTSLNALVDACDAIKQSASASRNRVFVVEVQGGKCGYLATMGALAVSCPSRPGLERVFVDGNFFW